MNQSQAKNNKFIDSVKQGESVTSSQTEDGNLVSDVEGSFYDNEQAQFLHEQIEDLRHYRDLRKKFSSKVYRFLVFWSIALFLILIFQGWFDAFDLGETVLLTLCGGTTISTIGLVGFIVRGLFGGKDK